VKDHLRLEERDGVAILTIDREERRNALHGPLWDALLRASVKIADRPPRVLIIVGAGRHFCAGMDLQPDNPLLDEIVPAIEQHDRTRLAEIIRRLKAVVNSVARLQCPVIAAIEGACIGGGLELALACDLRIASETAAFSLPETRIGMVPDVGGTVRLSHLVGTAHATDLVLTGRTVQADEAVSMGLVNRLTAAGGAFEEALSVAREICRGGPKATQQALLTLRQVRSASVKDAFEFETAAGAHALMSGEALEGLASFAEKRPPNWS
jgi:enoyl-CoA hydratase/carnithine racemase